MTGPSHALLDEVLRALRHERCVVRITIVQTEGSVPRDPGSSMMVTPDHLDGTIGGGRLEYLAVSKAREFLSTATPSSDIWPRHMSDFVLGTNLGQCCGGVVWLLFECYDATQVPTLAALKQNLRPDSVIVHPLHETGPLTHYSASCDEVAEMAGALSDGLWFHREEDTDRAWFMEPVVPESAQLVVYGAGHVGRALVRVMDGTPFNITWVDTALERFPEALTPGVQRIVSDPVDFAAQSPISGFHVVVTYSHEMDLDICRAVLKRGDARYLGLIASKTKRARFLSRLRADGLEGAVLDVFYSPIGVTGITGKDPAVIAISVAAELLTVQGQDS